MITGIHHRQIVTFQYEGFPGRGLTKDVSARDGKKSQGQDARSLVKSLPGKPAGLAPIKPLVDFANHAPPRT